MSDDERKELVGAVVWLALIAGFYLWLLAALGFPPRIFD